MNGRNHLAVELTQVEQGILHAERILSDNCSAKTYSKAIKKRCPTSTLFEVRYNSPYLVIVEAPHVKPFGQNWAFLARIEPTRDFLLTVLAPGSEIIGMRVV